MTVVNRIPNILTASKFSGYPVIWDYFTAPNGAKRGILRQISSKDLTLCSSVEIEERRWLRLILQHPVTNLALNLKGRVIYQESTLDSWPDDQITLFRQRIELFEEIPISWIEVLSDETLTICACGSLVKKEEPACGLCLLRSTLATSLP